MRKILFIIIALVLANVGSAFSAEFEHAEHNDYVDNAECSTCHVDGNKSIIPAMSVCLECHDQAFADAVELPALDSHGPLWGLSHRPAAKSNSIDCASCHQQDFCTECHKAGFADEQGAFTNALTNVHRSDFQVSHPIAARTNPQLCSSCHENNYCTDCHNAFAPGDLSIESHRRGWRNVPLVDHDLYVDDPYSCATCHPDSSVLPSSTGWNNAHAREARKNLATCQACHPNGDICLTCHSARNGLMVNPHPKDWNDMSDNLDRASGGKTCRKCH